MYRIVIMSEDNHVLFSEKEQNIPHLTCGDTILVDNKYSDINEKYIVKDIKYEFHEDNYNYKEVVIIYNVMK